MQGEQLLSMYYCQTKWPTAQGEAYNEFFSPAVPYVCVCTYSTVLQFIFKSRFPRTSFLIISIRNVDWHLVSFRRCLQWTLAIAYTVCTAYNLTAWNFSSTNIHSAPWGWGSEACILTTGLRYLRYWGKYVNNNKSMNFCLKNLATQKLCSN